ncbi:MAG: hypothetical protein K8U57_02545 [Planctomycetes bacterium]|nr:hypothetical protein [Planctomycetota bacterium]
MAATEQSEKLAEEARRGQEAFDRHVRHKLRPEDDGKYVAVEIHSGDYELDADDYQAIERLLARLPEARIFLLRVGYPTTYRLGFGGGA